jgi:hypothetical protein
VWWPQRNIPFAFALPARHDVFGWNRVYLIRAAILSLLVILIDLPAVVALIEGVWQFVDSHAVSPFKTAPRIVLEGHRGAARITTHKPV